MTVSPRDREIQLMKAKQAEEARREHLMVMEKGFQVADVFTNRQYLDNFSNAEISSLPVQVSGTPNQDKLRIYQITKIVFDKNEDINDKLTSVYNALYNLSIAVAVYIVGSESGVDFFIGVRSENLAPLAGNILEATLASNFPGINLVRLDKNGIENFIDNIGRTRAGISMLKGLATVSMIPAIRNKDRKEKNEQYVQGMEKFINTLRGKSYVAVLLAVPLGIEDIIIRRHGYEELFSALSPHSKTSIAYGENFSTAVNKGVSTSFTRSVNESVSNSNSTSSSSTEGTTSGSNSGSTWNGNGWSLNSGSSRSSSSSYTSGTSFSHSISNSIGTSEATSEQEGETVTTGTSETETLNFENKGVSDLMKKIEAQLERINQCESYGLWESCAYFFSDDIAVSILAATTYKSLMTGEKTNVENAHVNVWSGFGPQGARISKIMDYVKCLQHPRAKIAMPATYQDYQEQMVTPTSLVSGSELSFLLGIPRKSVAGLAVQEMAEFGRAVVYENRFPNRSISIGNIYHMGIEEKSTPVNMDLDLFSSHCFITGSSGSGKSYATYNLLDKFLTNGVKMLIVEPAKGEYKMVFGKMDKVNIFVTDVNTYRLLRINPFQFPSKIHILSHIEQLMQIFSASWSLSEAMPAILKDSVVQSYVRCGWDIRNSLWIDGISDHKYPVFQDVLDVLSSILDSSDYSAEVQGNYKGALLTRVKAMTTGLNGLIFRKSEGIDDSVLFDQNTIIDLSEVGSEETIALIMGTLIMRLSEYRKSQRKTGASASHDSGLKHITVLEEAHNLLKRTSKEQSQDSANMVGKSVEMISNSIKEMRTYGEGFLIIDQSPLAVDSSVVENTATKIIMNTPSKEACEELGSSISLNENQTRELSRLNVGVAAVMQKGWITPVLLKVGEVDVSKYETDMQYEELGKISYIRGKLAEELYRQVQEDRYSVRTLGEIIRSVDSRSGKPHLNADRQNEFSEITNLYSTFKSQSAKLSYDMIGILFMEIIGCEGLFDVIPQKGLYSAQEIASTLDDLETEEQQDEFYVQSVLSAKEWANKFTKAIEQYISVEPDVIQCALRYMLYFKGKGGDDVTSVFGQLYTFLSMGFFGEEE